MKYYEEKKLENVESLVNEFLSLTKEDLWAFRGQRDEKWLLGIHDIPEERILKAHMKQFKKRCMEFPQPDWISEFDEWRWLFYAQHHRLKTRLLDWTSNPLVALYFAVENILSKCDDQNHFGAVWALKVTKNDFLTPEEIGSPDKVERWIMVNPPPVTQRLVRQSGKFSFHPHRNSKQISEQPRRNNDEKLIKFILIKNDGSNPAREIREHLCTMNIHHSSLFPGPDGVAAFVNYEWPSKRLVPSAYD